MSTGNNNGAITNKPNITQEFKRPDVYSKRSPSIEEKKFIEALDEFNATLLSNMLEPIYENFVA
jgi:hypothetical protein